MIDIKPSGSATSAQTANQLGLTVSFLERYRKPRRCSKSKPIQTTVTYSVGDLSLNGTTLFVPVIATVTAVYLLQSGGTASKTFVETFTISFQNQDALTSGATVTKYGTVTDISTSSYGVTTLLIDDSIIIAVA